MSPVKCMRCGRTTNAVLSNWTEDEPTKADGCYAAVDESSGKWVTGCLYAKADQFSRGYADRMINRAV